MLKIAKARRAASFFLCCSAQREASHSVRGSRRNPTWPKSRTLFLGELDIPHPETDRRRGDAEHSCQPLDRQPVVAAKCARQLTLGCFHSGQQPTGKAGRSGRRESNPRIEGGNLALSH